MNHAALFFCVPGTESQLSFLLLHLFDSVPFSPH